MQVHPGVVVTDMGTKGLEGRIDLPLDDGEFAYSDSASFSSLDG
jgi:hypothetical protein